MSNAVIGALRADMSLSTAGLETGAAKAQQTFDRMNAKMRDTASKAQSAGRSLQKGLGDGLKGAEASAAAFAAEIDRLKTQFDPLYASSKRYEATLDELQRAQRLGAISAGQYEASLEALNAEFGRVGAGLTSVGRAGIQGGTGIQNVAFQLQDFAVQVGAGTSAAQALGQQLPQLLSGFGVIGALAGTTAAIGIPLLAMAFRGMGGDSRTAKEAIDDLTAAVSASIAANEAARAPAEDLAATYGAMATQAREALAAISEGERLAALEELDATAKKLALSFDGVSLSLFQYQDIFNQGTVASLRIADALGVTREAAEGLVAGFIALESAEGPVAVASAAGDLRDSLIQAGVAANDDLVMGLNRAAEQALRLAGSAPGPGWMGAAIGETNLLIGRLITAKAQADALRNVDAVKTQGLAAQYAQYGAGRAAFNEGARNASPLYNAPKVTISDRGGGGGGAGRVAQEVERLNTAVSSGASGVSKYQSELAKLDALKGNGLSDGAYAEGVRKLNAELANSSPLSGFSDSLIDAAASGKDALSALENSFKTALANIAKEIVNAQLGKLLASSIGQAGGGVGAALGGAAAGAGVAAAGAGAGLGGAMLAALGGPVGIIVGIGALIFGNARRQAEEAAAAQKAAIDKAAADYQRFLNQKSSLEERYYLAIGDKAALLAKERATIDQNLLSLYDLTVAREKQNAIDAERLGLEEQLLQLQGDEAELRRRALEKLDPSNRALQEQVYALRDAEEATSKLNAELGKLSEQNYASALDFARARGALAGGLRVVTGTQVSPSVAAAAAAAGAAGTADAILASINNNIALLWKQVQRWDADAVPTRAVA